MPRQTFKVGSALGRGGYAAVFVAIEQGLVTNVAVKKSRVSLREKRTVLRHEARVIQLLQGHPAIPKLFGYSRVQHFEYIAISLLGKDLKRICEPGHALKTGTVTRIAEQMISALEHLNFHGIVHRDIKPENILVDYSEPSRVCLVDFGIARKLTEADANPTHLYDPIESNRTVVGTLHWCSLNAHLGFDLRPYDDLESLVYTLLYLLMGNLPWRINAPRESTKKAMIRILAEKLAFAVSPFPAVVPPEFRDLLYFARNAKGNIKADLVKHRLKMHDLASTLGEVEHKLLDFTPRLAILTPENIELDSGSDTDSEVDPNQDSSEGYSNSYWGRDLDRWDMRFGRDKSLTFRADEADLLDGQIPEIAVIDKWCTARP